MVKFGNFLGERCFEFKFWPATYSLYDFKLFILFHNLQIKVDNNSAYYCHKE